MSRGRPKGSRTPPREPLGPAAPPAPELPIRWCIGCRKTTVKGWTYCARCRDRMAHGVPLDLDDHPTAADLERVREAERRRGQAPAGFNLISARGAA